MKKARYLLFILIFLLGNFRGIPVSALEDSDEAEEALGEEVIPDDEPLEEERELIILAVSAGGKNDKGELVELLRRSEESLLLTGVSIRYQNSSGSVDKTIYSFSDDIEMVGEKILLRLKDSEDANEADLNYSQGLAQKGGRISLELNGEIIDEVCWGDYPDCNGPARFLSDPQTTLVRDTSTMEFSHVKDYRPEWKEGREVLKLLEDDEDENNEDEEGDELLGPEILPVCEGLEFSELFSYFINDRAEQFIELYNPTEKEIHLEGCALRYKTKLYMLEGEVQAGEFFVIFPENLELSLTKNPKSSNLIELIDADGSVVDVLVYFNGQKKGVAFAQFGFSKDGKELWEQTYIPTPGEENNYQKYKPCPEGKVINEETGNCVRTVSLSTSLKACPEGWYRNPLTNRCKKNSTTSSSLKDCPEGYERNPETNRCRKIVKNEGADYEVAEEKFEEKSTFMAGVAIAIVGGIGIIYIIFEYRKEIIGFFKKKK